MAETMVSKSLEEALPPSEEGMRNASGRLEPAESSLITSPEKVLLEAVERQESTKTKSLGRAAHTPKLVTPVKRPVSAGLPRELMLLVAPIHQRYLHVAMC
jgi:hypothetical protein